MTKHDALRKQRIIDYIAATLRARGYPPSVREIAVAVDLASTSAVHHHLSALERDGYLERGATRSRALRLTPTAALHAGLAGEVEDEVHLLDPVFPGQLVVRDTADDVAAEAHGLAHELLAIRE